MNCLLDWGTQHKKTDFLVFQVFFHWKYIGDFYISNCLASHFARSVKKPIDVITFVIKAFLQRLTDKLGGIVHQKSVEWWLGCLLGI